MTKPYHAPFGPWLGVPKDRQWLCAIDGCQVDGLPHKCPADGNLHHHGCVHYEHTGEELYTVHKLRLRHGWGLLCDDHYKLVRAIILKQQEDARLPSRFCFGNPTKADCIKYGRCTRNPACDE